MGGEGQQHPAGWGCDTGTACPRRCITSWDLRGQDYTGTRGTQELQGKLISFIRQVFNTQVS